MARSKKQPRRAKSKPKHIVARELNSLFARAGTGEQLDGHTLRRKRRLLRELKEGRSGKALNALTALKHADELLQLGETLSSLRRLNPKVPCDPLLDEDAVEILAEAQSLYRFDPKAWKLLGVNIERVVAMV